MSLNREFLEGVALDVTDDIQNFRNTDAVDRLDRLVLEREHRARADQRTKDRLALYDAATDARVMSNGLARLIEGALPPLVDA